MAREALERRVENIERRLTAVEQILPTLATRADLEAAIAPLATKTKLRAEIEAVIAPLATKAEVRAEIQAAIAPLATKIDVSAEIQAEGIRTRRHFDVVAEGLHTDIRMVAEAVVALQARGDAHYTEIKGVLAQHD